MWGKEGHGQPSRHGHHIIGLADVTGGQQHLVRGDAAVERLGFRI